MIEKITLKTTVEELLEVLNYMCEKENADNCRIELYSDMSGNFNDDGVEYDYICDIDSLHQYIKDINILEDKKNNVS